MPTVSTSASVPGRVAGVAVPPGQALGIAGAALGGFLLAIGLLAPIGVELLAVVGGELMLLLVPLVAMVRTRRPLAALGVVRPPMRHVLAALAIGSSAWYLNLHLVRLLPIPTGDLRGLSGLVDAPPLSVALLAIALVPAVCEEVLFRGLVLRAIAPRLGPSTAIVVTAVAFAAYHMSVVQLVPTFTLGLLAGLLAYQADSIAPAIVAHVLNNTIAILVSRGELPVVDRWLAGSPVAAVAGCAAMVGGGVVLTLIAPRHRAQQPEIPRI